MDRLSGGSEMTLGQVLLGSFVMAQVQMPQSCNPQAQGGAVRQEQAIESGVTVTVARVPMPGPSLGSARGVLLGPGWWTDADPVKVAAMTSALRPVDFRILQDTGWANYVTTCADSLRYHDVTGFKMPDGRAGAAMGISTFRNGWRHIDVATRGYSDELIGSVLTHECAHLQDALSTRRSRDEKYARYIQQRFLSDYARVFGTPVINVNERFPMSGVAK
jgi:hypothetical protein